MLQIMTHELHILALPVFSELLSLVLRLWFSPGLLRIIGQPHQMLGVLQIIMLRVFLYQKLPHLFLLPLILLTFKVRFEHQSPSLLPSDTVLCPPKALWITSLCCIYRMKQQQYPLPCLLLCYRTEGFLRIKYNLIHLKTHVCVCPQAVGT
jgi:hypothetical protein